MSEILFYIALLSWGLIGIYAFRRAMLLRQHKKDAEVLARALKAEEVSNDF